MPCIFLVLSSFCSFAQILKEYTLELTFETSIISKIENIGTTHKWTLTRADSSCTLNNIEYRFEQKDSLLRNYFVQLDRILSLYKFHQLSNNSIVNGVQTGMWIDGTMTYGNLIFNNSSIKFSFHSGNINFDSIQIKLLDNFFNIVYFLYNQPIIKEKILRGNVVMLDIDETSAGSSSFREVSENPLKYRLCRRVYDKEFSTVMIILSSLPKNQPVFIEVGESFEYEKSDLFISHFKEFIQSPNRIIWKASENTRHQLIALGVKRKNIVENRNLNIMEK